MAAKKSTQDLIAELNAFHHHEAAKCLECLSKKQDEKKEENKEVKKDYDEFGYEV